MPFTLSHPAVVVSLAKFGLPLSALVVGSVVPDLPTYLGLSHHTRNLTHSALGIVLVCVPVGLVTLSVFHRLLKLPLLSLLPENHQQRLAPLARNFHFLPLPQLGVITTALFVGSLSHLVWDEFTSTNRVTEEYLPFFTTPISVFSSGPIPLVIILNYLCSIMGLGYLTYSYVQWFNRAPVELIDVPIQFSQTTRRRLITSMSLVAVVTCLISMRQSSEASVHFSGGVIYGAMRQIIVAACTALGIQIVLFSLVWHWLNYQKK
jgi:hypothetical protein